MSFVYKNVAKVSLSAVRKSARQSYAPLVARQFSAAQEKYKASEVVRKISVANFSYMRILSFVASCRLDF
jgi:hypothetical protein